MQTKNLWSILRDRDSGSRGSTVENRERPSHGIMMATKRPTSPIKMATNDHAWRYTYVDLYNHNHNHMCMIVYVHIYIYICIHMYVYIYIHIYIYIYTIFWYTHLLLFWGFDLTLGRSMTPGLQKERFRQNQRRARQLCRQGNQLLSKIVALFNWAMNKKENLGWLVVFFFFF